MCLPNMAAVVKHLPTVCLVLAFVVGVMAQLMPPSAAAPQMTMSVGVTGASDGPRPPCTGHTRGCIDHIGCVTVSALPTSPASIAVPIEWTLLDYHLAAQALAGISVEPELSPPILVA